MTQPQLCRARSHFWNQLFVFQKLKKAIYRLLTLTVHGGGGDVVVVVMSRELELKKKQIKSCEAVRTQQN